MSKELSQVETANTPNYNKQQTPLKNNAFTMLASFTGVVFGVLGSLGFVTSYLHTQLADQTAALNRSLGMRNADLTSQCTGTSSPAGAGAGGASVQTASASTPGKGGGGGAGQGAGGNTFVHKLVNGVLTSNGTISNTGQGSTNTVSSNLTATTTVTNTNTLTATNNNPQVAVSGSATSNNNTTGGAANSGDSDNNSSTTFSYTVNN